MTELITIEGRNNTPQIAAVPAGAIPVLVADAGDRAKQRYIEFFTANIRNRNTRGAYFRAVREFFKWCQENQIGPLIDIEAVHVAGYIEQMTQAKASQTVKQHLAALKAFFDYLVTGGVLSANPASAVRGPKHSQTKGKTPVLSAEDARAFLRSIPTDNLAGLRDRAIIGVMVYGFARVSAALNMDAGNVFAQQHRLWLKLHEKGGKYHEIPCHHSLEEYLRHKRGSVSVKYLPSVRASAHFAPRLRRGLIAPSALCSARKNSSKIFTCGSKRYRSALRLGIRGKEVQRSCQRHDPKQGQYQRLVLALWLWETSTTVRSKSWSILRGFKFMVIGSLSNDRAPKLLS